MKALVESRQEPLNLNLKAVDIFKALTFLDPNTYEDLKVPGDASKGSSQAKAFDCIYKLVLVETLKEFLQLDHFPYELYKEAFDSYIKEISSLLIPKSIRDDFEESRPLSILEKIKKRNRELKTINASLIIENVLRHII